MIGAAARRTALQPVLLCAGLTSAMALRLAVAGDTGNRSAPAGAMFGVALLALAAAAGWRPGRPSWRAVLLGGGGGLALVLVPAALRVVAPSPLRLGLPVAGFAPWLAVMAVVAVGEEVLLRGALMDAVMRHAPAEAAVAVAAVAFALLHVPLYGWGAVPIDLAAGVWLGGLRLAGGGVAAPALAHGIADVAAWWLR